MIRLALYQPDIAQNTGTLLRLGACLGLGVDIIEPCGFPFSLRALRRAGLDYLDHVEVVRHTDWPSFDAARKPTGRRLILLSTHASTAHWDFEYRADDILLLGRESAGVPEVVEAATDARIRIPMRPGMRSLNVAVAAAMVITTALARLRPTDLE